MSEMVLLGDEALALGAIHAGISTAYGYPGTPSSEIMAYLQSHGESEKYLAQWCSNEKTAYEAAVGVSLVGKRTLVTLKHVGLNVAADPFVNSALLSIHGGLVLAVADDPGMHSSQNEQDSRFYADFARILCLEPRNQQEVYDMTREAFDLSERFHIPIMVRLVTRIAHSRAVIHTAEPREQNQLDKSQEKAGWMLLPATARRLWAQLLEQQKELLAFCESSKHNSLTLNPDFSEFGVITTGLGRNYYEENLGELTQHPSHLHIGAYPIPVEKVRTLAAAVDRIVVLEEGFSVVERALLGLLPLSIEVTGKESGEVPRTGELTPDNVRPAIGLKPKKGVQIEGLELPMRPPQLCAGCPHRDTYDALNQALTHFPQKIVTSDIGCYTLGYLPPYQAIETCLCMGASVGMAKGAAQAGFFPVVAAIGDGTFLHSGITPLVDAVDARANMTLIIMDNSTTAMTGGQTTILTSERIQHLVLGIGVDPDHMKVINPLKRHTKDNAEVIRREIEYSGVSVIIALRDCVQILKGSFAKKEEKA